MALISRPVIGENRQRKSCRQNAKAFLKGMIGFAVEVLHVYLLGTEVVIELLISGVRMPVQCQHQAVG